MLERVLAEWPLLALLAAVSLCAWFVRSLYRKVLGERFRGDPTLLDPEVPAENDWNDDVARLK